MKTTIKLSAKNVTIGKQVMRTAIPNIATDFTGAKYGGWADRRGYKNS